MAILVSILSDQLIPNVLFIKQMAAETDNHIFLSTKEMEHNNKSTILAETLGFTEEKYKVVIIDSNNPSLILSALKNYEWPLDIEYVVNITGGNKMMSQMAYLYFSENANSRIYYWPIGANSLEQLHPVIKEISIIHPYQLDLVTYFAAHGYSFSCENRLSYPINKANALFHKVIKAGSADQVTEIRQAKEIEYNKADKMYYLGGWFEEWLFSYLRDTLKLSESQISYNLKLKNRHSVSSAGNNNEIDVAFVYSNRLFLWECKVYYSSQIYGKKIGEAIYKISSVSQSLGLQATSLVAILSPFGNSSMRKDFINDITKIMRIKKVFSLEDMANIGNFSSQIKQIIK